MRSFLLLTFLPAVLLAGDWPQWRGPDRTGGSSEKGLLKTWPKDGPKLMWTATKLGEGYTTPSVAGGKVFLMGAKNGEEYAIALDEKDGSDLWSVKVGKVGVNRGPSYPGPRSTPTIDGDRLYTLGSDGDLVCLETAKGKLVWRYHLAKDFKGIPGFWSYGESVLIDGDHLLCTPGGPEATILCLNKKNGKVV